jgi:PAS domain S-box-containing protein
VTEATRRDSDARSEDGFFGHSGASLLSRFDPLIPPAIAAHGGADLMRARMTAGVMILAALLYVSNGLYQLVAASPHRGVAVANLVCAAALFASFLLFRGLRRQDLFASTFLTVAFGQLVFLWVASGGENLGALFSLSSVVVASVGLASWRFGVAATLLSCAVVGASVVLLPAEAAAYGSLFGGHIYRDAIFLLLGVGGISTIYDWTRELADREAKLARESAEASERAARHATETLSAVADISRRVQRARGDALEKEIDAGVATAAEIAGARRAVLKVFDNRQPSTLARHASDDLEDEFDARDPEVLARCAWSVGKLAAGEIIAFADCDEMPPETAAEREVMVARGVRAWLVIPVRIGPNRFGYFSFESGEVHDWSTIDMRPLQLLGEILATATTQHLDEVARAESEEKFAKAFSANPDGMLLADLETGAIVECNDRFLEFAAVAREWVMGRQLSDLTERFDALHNTSSGKRYLELGREVGASHEEEIRIRSRGGMRVYIFSSSFIEIGGRRHLLTSVRDVSERRELESQLLQAQKMEAVGRLAGGVAHDFNNMLTVIQGHSEGLRESLGDSHGDELDAIHDAVTRSTALTRRLLTFSRRQMLNPTRVDLRELVERVDAMLRGVIGEDIHLETHSGEAPAVIEVDESQMEQALLNLVVNARDAVTAGGRIDVLTDRVDIGEEEAARRGIDAGSYARLRIADDGCGMEQEILDRVLDPFFTTKQEGKGSGLGLSMVDGFVRQSGGALSISSQPGGGTVVELFFPSADLGATERLVVARLDETPGRTGTVLLAEDEDGLRRLARRALEGVGHTVIEAKDGVDALARAAAFDGPIDVLLTDAVMPRLGGFDLAGRLRSERPGIRVLVMSGYPEGSRAGDGPPPGFEILPKPFLPSELRRQVTRLLEDRPSQLLEDPPSRLGEDPPSD